MEDEMNAFYVVRKGDVIGIYRNFSDCQEQAGSSVSLPLLFPLLRSIHTLLGYGGSQPSELSGVVWKSWLCLVWMENNMGYKNTETKTTHLCSRSLKDGMYARWTREAWNKLSMYKERYYAEKLDFFFFWGEMGARGKSYLEKQWTDSQGKQWSQPEGAECWEKLIVTDVFPWEAMGNSEDWGRIALLLCLPSSSSQMFWHYSYQVHWGSFCLYIYWPGKRSSYDWNKLL